MAHRFDSPLFIGHDDYNVESPSATSSFTATASSSSAASPSLPSSPEQASPRQPSFPADFRNFYAANLPPSPLHHYYGQPFYPPDPMPQPRVASGPPPAPPSNRLSGGAISHHHHRTSRINQAPLPLPENWRQAWASSVPAPVARRSQPRPPPRQPAPRQPAPRPQPEMIDLTLSSPVEVARDARPSTSSSSTHPPARKKRRTIDTMPMILLDDDDDDDDDDDSEEEEESDDYNEPEERVPEVPKDSDERPKKFAGTACIICMEDEPIDLSVTPCGHMFCNKCLFGAIKATLASPHKVHGKCPVCRGKVAVKDIIVLEIKKLSKGKERAH